MIKARPGLKNAVHPCSSIWNKELVSLSGSSPVTVGHLHPGGMRGESALTYWGIFGSAIHRSSVLPIVLRGLPSVYGVRESRL